MNATKRLIVALDGDWDLPGLTDFAGRMVGEVGMVKIGKRLFTRHGPAATQCLREQGLPFFLDLKFHDIPNTVAQALGEAVALGCDMVNVHASGGSEMMKRARASVDECAARLGVPKPALIAVTVLTSLDEEQLLKVGVSAEVPEQVLRLAKLAKDCGLDGVVASPNEVGLIREALGRDFLVVTPGIRPAGKVAGDDQKRILTPAEAIRQGVDYIVVGRPVYGADDPLSAARDIVAQMAEV